VELLAPPVSSGCYYEQHFTLYEVLTWGTGLTHYPESRIKERGSSFLCCPEVPDDAGNGHYDQLEQGS
jgi:hypothetical protein